MIEKLILPEIRELIEAGDLTTLGDVMNRWLPADLAGVVSNLSEEEALKIVRLVEPPLSSEMFEYLEWSTQQHLLDELTEQESASLLEGMAPDDRTALLEELPRERAERLIELLSPAQRAVARSLLQYSKDTVGRLMTPDFVAIRKEWTIKHVLDHVRTHGRDSETLNAIYVVDNANRLLDELRIREVLLAPLHSHVRDIMDNQFVALHATDDNKSAIEVFRKYDRTALPVIDSRGTLVGIVTIDDVLDIAEEEATREIQKFGGLEALDDPYIETPLASMVRKRATWLIILFLSEMLTATAMGFFQGALSKAVVLALFVPLIISSGGNSGSQAATLIIRALALGEVTLKDWWLVMRREIAAGLMLGVILGAIGFCRIALWSVVFPNIYTAHWPLIAVTVGLSLVGVVLWGTLSGSMLPLLLKRLGFDPATSSAPFVATLVDVTGLIIYFSVAIVVLKHTLLR
ncbi:MAG: magnesium transporter [Planctomycetaceae bacterium]|nr:magnesium transporter [Planctomycetaceae bacterium]MBV8610555.1 magnesium transporter [Singulisphaera sp.]MBV8265397.1 magnesium transporter [Planctomycetaceae bacterium]MBV8316063.1 magnesium transporter [Planctomycetaceae bacterium]MBV8558185.1 magnesium transporter [Planctomycetaceae bacterium]